MSFADFEAYIFGEEFVGIEGEVASVLLGGASG
ncbi:uncharacterized protein METZ01_LOCUS461512 [marine metagenome]|uniref:Uncharacterized protein n=1 Tax=marine metagenome TaxID=408172 RepID=A0A383ANG9_9ZZZZ